MHTREAVASRQAVRSLVESSFYPAAVILRMFLHVWWQIGNQAHVYKYIILLAQEIQPISNLMGLVCSILYEIRLIIMMIEAI